MTNRHRGDITVEIGGRERRLRLTLGALADLEAAFAADDMLDLARRFGDGRLKARDAVVVLAAGLRGAGEAVTDREVAAMAIDGGAPAYADAVVRLLAVTFGGGEAVPGGQGGEEAGEEAVEEAEGARPFPGRTPSPSASAS